MRIAGVGPKIISFVDETISSMEEKQREELLENVQKLRLSAPEGKAKGKPSPSGIGLVKPLFMDPPGGKNQRETIPLKNWLG